MSLMKHLYDAALHNKGTVGKRSRCSWHGETSCTEAPTSSYRTPLGTMAACPRAEREIEGLYGPPTRGER